MSKYKLTKEEREVVIKFHKYSIPFIFSSGKYCGYMQYFELVDSEICSALLKGKNIDRRIYQMITLEGVEVIKEDLYSTALEFYNLYLLVEELVKKYY